jgi:hypothetical protein
MSMALYEIDDLATQRRLEAVTAEAVRSLDECGERSDQIDRDAREAFAREAAEREAMAEEIEKGRRPEPPPDEAGTASPWQRKPPKQTVLSLGGDEILPAQPPAATEPNWTPPPVPPPTVQPDPLPTPAQPAGPRDHVLSLGFEDDDSARPTPPAAAAPPPPPVRRPPRASDEDDDLSGQRWMR